ncbi:hypothetical protein [Scopulibacillus darangshiensis]|nr:hypothetical protein [Scopulibacillus darangshiensis]
MNCPTCNGNGELECRKCQEKQKDGKCTSHYCHDGVVICPRCCGNGRID